MKSDEAFAAGVLRSVFPGRTLRLVQSQAHGEWDIDMTFDGETEPVEVTRSTDEQLERIYGAIHGSRRGGPFFDRKLCHHDWFISPAQDANIPKIRREGDRYLAAVEAESRSRFFSEMDRYDSPAVASLHDHLRIEAGSTIRWIPTGRIGIGLPGAGGTLDPNSVTSAVEAEANKPDNRSKLSKSGAANRHLVVMFTGLDATGQASMLQRALPTQPASLPAEITTVWAMAPIRTAPVQFLVWSCSEGQWQDRGEHGVK